MTVAIIYARVSTEDQAKHGFSLLDQISNCSATAKKMGATKLITCVDEGLSGDLLERPGLTKARELIRSQTVNYFICSDPDRLARKLAHQLIITDEIERLGCKLIFVNFQWQNTPEGRLFYSLRGAIAEFEKEKIKERTMRGLRQKALQGGLTHNPNAYGYNYNKSTNSLEILEEEAQVYRLISRWFLEENLGYHAIATRLTKLGIPTKRGASAWSATTIARMLTNPLYHGELWLQRYNTVGRKNNKYLPKNERVQVTKYPKEHHVLLKVPAIIDKDTFQAHLKQAKRISRIWKKRHFHGDYLLSGLLCCEICNGAMSGTRSGKRKYYRCNKGSACPLPYKRAEPLEKAIWEQVKAWLSDLKLVKNILTGELLVNHSEKSIIKGQLLEAEKERTRLIDLIQKGLLSLAEGEERLQEISQRLTKLKSGLEKEENVPAPSLSNLKQVKTTIEIAMNLLDFEGRQRLVRNLIEQIQIGPENITILSKIPKPIATKECSPSST